MRYLCGFAESALDLLENLVDGVAILYATAFVKVLSIEDDHGIDRV